MSDDTPAASPAKPVAELAIGRMTKEQKRNIRRAIGEVASRAIDDCRAMAYEVYTQQSALAKELVAFQDEARQATKAVNVRVTGASEWCAKNEKATAALAQRLELADQRVETLTRDLRDQRRRIDILEGIQTIVVRNEFLFASMTLWQRLRWLLGGDVPGVRGPAASWVPPVTVPRTPEEREAFAADIGRP